MRMCLKCGMSVYDFIESSPRDVYNVVRAGIEKREEEIEQGYDYTRRIMWAALAAMNGDKIKAQDLIRLKRDDVNKKELSPYELQQIKELGKKWDDEMMRDGLIKQTTN